MPSLRRILIKVSVPDKGHDHIRLAMDVVDAEIPMIVGLPDLRKHEILVDYIDMFKVSKVDRWFVPLKDHNGLVYYGAGILTT